MPAKPWAILRIEKYTSKTWPPPELKQPERYIQRSIDALKGEVTVVIIAHRLSTIKNVDRVYVLDEGRVMEEGASYKGRFFEAPRQSFPRGPEVMPSVKRESSAYEQILLDSRSGRE